MGKDRFFLNQTLTPSSLEVGTERPCQGAHPYQPDTSTPKSLSRHRFHFFPRIPGGSGTEPLSTRHLQLNRHREALLWGQSLSTGRWDGSRHRFLINQTFPSNLPIDYREQFNACMATRSRRIRCYARSWFPSSSRREVLLQRERSRQTIHGITPFLLKCNDLFHAIIHRKGERAEALTPLPKARGNYPGFRYRSHGLSRRKLRLPLNIARGMVCKSRMRGATHTWPSQDPRLTCQLKGSPPPPTPPRGK